MLLIATDEAGYGPKLGPLVIAATVWRVPDDADHTQLHALFAPLRESVLIGKLALIVDDSKAVYQPSTGLDALHAVVSASLAWCRIDADCFQSALQQICPKDAETIHQTPWLDADEPVPMLDRNHVGDVVNQWRSSGLELLDVRARVITAQSFNEACSHGSNKADLLSQSTLNLVKELWQKHGSSHPATSVYCDRHGGRRYYAGVLQHVIPEAWVHVDSESAEQSSYRLSLDQHTMRVHFTVKGDSFTPVALASMHAKYIRERMMNSLNRYFANLVKATLKPTAGYPVDADRFLRDIAPAIEQHQIDRNALVRSR